MVLSAALQPATGMQQSVTAKPASVRDTTHSRPDSTHGLYGQGNFSIEDRSPMCICIGYNMRMSLAQPDRQPGHIVNVASDLECMDSSNMSSPAGARA